MRISPNLLGALFMTMAMAAFACNDATAKLLTREIGIGQIMFFRGLFLLAFALVIVWRSGAAPKLKAVARPRILIRSLCELIAAMTLLYALKIMPLANATAILQFMPLVVTLGAALFMGESVGWRRWSAIIVGFIGVMIIIRPGPGGFDAGAILVVLAVLAASVRDLVTKTIAQDIPAIVMSISTGLTITVGGAILGTIEQDWNLMTWMITFKLAIAALFLLLGYQFVVFAVRKADMSYIAPFRYTGLLWAALLGIIVFANYPDIHVLLGGGIVVLAGLYSFYRERQRGIAPLAETTQPGVAEGGGLIARAEGDALKSRKDEG